MEFNMTIEDFQNLVIGSGVAGKILAWTLASQGQRTVVVERAMVGGSCPTIRVNHRLRTSASEVWATGACAGGPQFTHVGQTESEARARGPPYRIARLPMAMW
jgi:pyruvate/2-oxoglutarate dehydrogenase complex dihydrolipoamide dehydrogenase (E3) component